MPAAAVIPVPIADIEVVAVKKFVVEMRRGRCCEQRDDESAALRPARGARVAPGVALFVQRHALSRASYFEENNVSKAGVCLNILAWNSARPFAQLVGALGTIDRSGRGRRYYAVRGEILGFASDQQMRKHSPSTLPLIKS